MKIQCESFIIYGLIFEIIPIVPCECEMYEKNNDQKVHQGKIVKFKISDLRFNQFLYMQINKHLKMLPFRFVHRIIGSYYQF